MEIYNILLAQFWVGILQLTYSLIVTLVCLGKYQTIPKTLGTYWLLVLAFFSLLGFFFLVANELALIFLFSAWFIAVYWLAYFIPWAKFKQ